MPAVAAALVALLGATLSVGTGSAAAQSFPERTVKIVVGQPPGSGPDKIARLVAEQLSQLWKESVVVENRTGAGATIAAELVAKSRADGYTLLLGGQSSLAVAAATNSDLRYDPLTEFAFVGRIARVPAFLVMNPAVPVRTIPELIAYARAHPGRLTLASFGAMTASGLQFRRFVADSGIDVVEIVYRDNAVATTDLLAGRVDIGLLNYGEAREHVASGRLRMLGTTAPRRAPFAPEVPTIAEQGVPGFKIETWYGLVAPAGIPPEVFARLRDAVSHVQASQSARQRIVDYEFEPIADDASQFAAVVRSDIEEFSRLAKRTPQAAGSKAASAPP